MKKVLKTVSLVLLITMIFNVLMTVNAYAASSTSDIKKMADVNKDGKVDDSDLYLIENAYKNVKDPNQKTIETYDIDGDGLITSLDYYYVTCVKNNKYPTGDLNKNFILDKEDFYGGRTTGEPYRSRFERVWDDLNILRNNDCFKDDKGNKIDSNTANSIKIAYKNAYKNKIKGLKVSEKQLDELLDILDINLDGHISYADYGMFKTIADVNVNKDENTPMHEHKRVLLTEYDVNCNGKYDKGDYNTLKWALSSEKTIKYFSFFYDLNGDKKLTKLEDLGRIYFKQNNKLASFNKKGDVNKDGYVTEKDLTIVRNYVNSSKNTKMDNFTRKIADYNGDGRVNVTDISLIANQVKKNKGDLNLDNKITVTDLEKLFAYLKQYKKLNNEMEINNADMNSDGKINVTDLEILITKVKGISKNSFKKGDLNLDGKVNVSDATKLAAYIKSIKTINNEMEMINADINSDGTINSTDLSILQAHVKGTKTSSYIK